ncbi:hypothetical protein BDM02DRAFT_3111358 [Thelephora ganbajun]|uniref:Uncharacterized protein n=1 Tax=Thelephora ganbajun TaxID=370292 RepID=A0ACB6ZNE3_THEGA|nr:hypothetical protein BDM02DRAFT_3111358 [Thelephora ganbajun]
MATSRQHEVVSGTVNMQSFPNPQHHSDPTIPGTHLFQGSMSDSALVEKEHSPKQPRVSFDSDPYIWSTSRGTHPASGSAGNTGHTSRSLSPAKRTGGSPRNRSPAKPVGDNPASPRSDTPGSLTPSRSASRAASPLRFLQQWALHRTHSRDEPFIPVDPFKWHFRICSPGSTDEQSLPITCCIPITPVSDDQGLFSDTLPRQLYLCLLLRLPAVYFSRVARIFEDAEVSRNDMQRIIESNRPSKLSAASRRGVNNAVQPILPFPEDWTPPAVSPALARFKNSWEEFIDSLLREWKTINLVSGLICSAIVTMFQVPEMAYDPITRTAAIMSLVCALMSLAFGCLFIIRFGTMRSMHHASTWAEEAQKTRTSILWNVWVLLATPSVWLAWSVIAFIVSILSYVWRAGATDDPENGGWPRLTPTQALGPRLTITVIVVLGLLNFLMILRTFKKYGKNNGSFIELPGSHQTPEGDVTSSVVRGRDLSRKVVMEPPASSPAVGEGTSSVDRYDLEKIGAEQRVSIRQ